MSRSQVNKCNVRIVVATNKLQTRSPEGAAVRVEYSRDSILQLMTVSMVDCIKSKSILFATWQDSRLRFMISEPF